jgi:5-methylthioadenosine/S-adenosylhomocysteine deaminase
MFEEMRLASFVAKAISGDPTALPARTTFAMATIMGAKALHIDHLTGSIEVGKNADLALVDMEALHTLPHFHRDPESVYSRLVYSAKSTDVTHVMVNGKWLMIDLALETIDEEPLIAAIEEYATKIDHFLIEREGSVLSKLIAIGDAIQEESYEVQIKVRLPDQTSVIKKLENLDLDVLRTAHYLEYDTYFSFSDRNQGRLRYREDEFVNKQGDVYNVRYRLTLTGPAAERAYPNYVLLSRSRFIAPATHSLRFYREYFNPQSETEITKDRLRWLVRFRGEEFFINIDQILKPKIEGCFLEVKSRTWSRRDAERKSELISELIGVLGITDPVPVEVEYPDLIAAM